MTARALTTRHLVLRARVGATAVRFVCLTLTCCVLALGLVSHFGPLFAGYSSPKLIAAVMFGERLDPPFAEPGVSNKLVQFSGQRVMLRRGHPRKCCKRTGSGPPRGEPAASGPARRAEELRSVLWICNFVVPPPRRRPFPRAVGAGSPRPPLADTRRRRDRHRGPSRRRIGSLIR